MEMQITASPQLVNGKLRSRNGLGVSVMFFLVACILLSDHILYNALSGCWERM